MTHETILILGGTNFIGRNLVERLCKNKRYKITLFNRQQTNGDLFPNLFKIKGNRHSNDIARIADKKWDFIIDLSCYFPNDLENTLKNLKVKPKNYIFISTCSVYDLKDGIPGLKNESTNLLSCSSFEKTNPKQDTYGNRKAECERILTASDMMHTILRPALVYGRYDTTDRLYYWLFQVKKRDTILIPEKGQRKFSMTYVTDLVETITSQIKVPKSPSTHQVISQEQTSIQEILQQSQKILSKEFKEIHISAKQLRANNIKEWIDIPLWINSDHWTFKGHKNIETNDQSSSLLAALKETITYYETMKWPIPNYGIKENVQNKLINICLKNTF